MSTLILLLVTGLGLGALYFLVAAGLSLIWGLMRVLNFAHGAFFTVAGYTGYFVTLALAGASPWLAWFAALLAGGLVGGAFATLTEVGLIRPLYRRPVVRCWLRWAWPWPRSRSSKALSAPTPARRRCPPG